MRDILHVAHAEGLSSYRLSDGERVGGVDAAPGSSGFAAVTVAPEGTVFVSDLDAGRVYRVDPLAGERAAVPVASLPQVTGVAFDLSSDRLYLATGSSEGEAGRLWSLTADATAPTPLGQVRADFTSLVLRSDRLIASTLAPPTVAERLLLLDTSGVIGPPLPSLHYVAPGQADILGGDLLFVPNTGALEVSIARIPRPAE